MRPTPAREATPRPGPLPLEAHLGQLEATLEREHRARVQALDRWLQALALRPRRFGVSAWLPPLG